MRAVDAMIAEIEQESEATRRLLERLPDDKLAWKPHDKSMTLGQLALHVATATGDVADMLELEELDGGSFEFGNNPQPESKDQILEAMDERLANARAKLGALDDASAMAMWTLKVGNEVAFSIPRIALARSLMLNHWYHHRGQLTVYLRMLDVPLPVTYGATADENPFQDMLAAQASATA